MLKIKFVFLSVAMILAASIVFAQTDSIAFAAADTSRFSPNRGGGWKLYNSFVSISRGNIATLELIIQHANNIDWTTEQFVGAITDKSLMPRRTQNISFSLLNDNYELRINENGRCFIRFVNGNLPTNDPFIIPAKIFYKLQ